MPTTISDQLTAYLSDAHSIEEQALAQLRTAPDLAAGERMKQAFRDHLIETEDHERSTRWLLEGRDSSPSWFKDFVMKVGGKGFILFARANPDTPGKLLAARGLVRGARGGVVPPARDGRAASAARGRGRGGRRAHPGAGDRDARAPRGLLRRGRRRVAARARRRRPPGAGGQVSGRCARARGAGDPAARARVGRATTASDGCVRRTPRRDAGAGARPSRPGSTRSGATPRR